VHFWADLQSVHVFRCHDNIAPSAKCQRVLVLALCLVRLLPTTTGVRYDLEMDVLIDDTEGRRGCLYQPGGTARDCRSRSRAVLMFPDDIIERRSVEAHWVAVFPVGGAPLAVRLKLPLLPIIVLRL